MSNGTVDGFLLCVPNVDIGTPVAARQPTSWPFQCIGLAFSLDDATALFCAGGGVNQC